MNQKRRSRFKRDSDRPTRAYIKISPRDLSILEAVWKYRILSVDQLSMLIPAQSSPPGATNPKHPTMSQTNLYRRLRKLYDYQYLTRLWDGPAMYYALDMKGAEELASNLGVPLEDLRWTVYHNRIGRHYLNHLSMVTRFHLALELACRNNPQVKLLTWIGDTRTRDPHTRELLDRVRVPRFKKTEAGEWVPKTDREGEVIKDTLVVCPDAVFSLEVAGKGKGTFMLEVDLSTMTTTRFKNKLRAYYYWKKAGGHSKRYYFTKNEQGELILAIRKDTGAEEGIKGFTVLTLTKATQSKRKERQKNLIKAIQNSEIPKSITWFWFASADEIDLAAPETVLEPIWETSRDDDQNLYSLLQYGDFAKLKS